MSRLTSVKLGLNYGSFYLYAGIFVPFLGLWLKSRGLTASEIGIIIAIPHIMKIISAPVISQMADKREEYWRPLMICTGISLFFFSFYFIANNFLTIFMVSVAVSLVMPAMMPLLETITLNQVRRCNLNYGRIRSVGSLSFIVATLSFGLFLKSNSVDYVIWATFIALALFLITALFLPRGNRRLSSTFDQDKSRPIRIMLVNRDFIIFLVIVGLLQMSHGVYYSMGSIHWKENGIEEDIIGLLWAIGVIAEIGIFVFCDKLISRFNTYYFLIIIALFGALRWGIIAVSFSVPLLLVTQLIHGLTYGAAHLVAIKYISSNISDKYSGTAQSLYSALPLGFAMAVSTYLGSVAYGAAGYYAYYLMSGLCVFAIIISVFALRLRK